MKNHHDSITQLTALDGTQLVSFDQISGEAVSFFKGLLGSKDEQVKGYPHSLLDEMLKPLALIM